MAGLYIHIPFCRKACNYCNFHFSTSLKYKTDLLEAIAKELVFSKTYLSGKTIRTIYLGGGTPSLLSQEEILTLFDTINQHYHLADDLEITLEANPDDLTLSYLKRLKQTPINRLSIGIQSFEEEDLLFMKRAHNAIEAKACIQLAQQVGFDNLTIDFIYGSPTTSHQQWEKNLQTAFDLKIPHISCYALTVEPKTALENHIRRGIKPAVEDEHAAVQFEILLAMMQANGYEQYEISNFCLPPNYAQHNTNYWKGVNYLGVGPSAHSFNGQSRQWNIANNAKYIKAINEGQPFWELETLTIDDQHNEYIMTALRTKWGISLEKLEKWGEDKVPHFQKVADTYLAKGLLEKHEESYRLTAAGKLIANHIMADFFV